MIVTIATIAAVTLSLPLAVLGIECWFSLLPLRRHESRRDMSTAAIRIAVIVPAHNEEDRIASTVRTISQQLDHSARVIVVADNCDDATAERAEIAGAAVWRRDDPEHRGKGFALNYALERLKEDPPEVVVCVDADCDLGPDCIQSIARLADQYQRPVQAAYTMLAPTGGSALACVSALAVHVKNIVRPRGLQRLGLPCLLTGSGMAFPWKAFDAVQFPDGHIVEDLRISTDLAIAGYAPMPCMENWVCSLLPEHRSGFLSQRTRWEHGHMTSILLEGPRLLAEFVKRPSLRILSLLAELTVPPLSILVATTVVSILAFAGVSYGVGSWTPLITISSVAAFAFAGLLIVWLREGRKILPSRMALEIPRYALVKAPMYLRFVTNRQHAWIRTERSAPATDEPIRR